MQMQLPIPALLGDGVDTALRLHKWAEEKDPPPLDAGD